MTGAEVETRTIRTPDGRDLMLELGGDRSGRVVIVHNGTPNSRHLYGPWLDDAAHNGICLVGYDRPGYGGSTAQPGRTVADCATDLRTIAAALGAARIAVWGASGGGPHALACAALVSDIVVAVSALCSIAPYNAPGLDYFAGMGEHNLDHVRLYLGDRDAAREKSRQNRLDLLATTPAQLQDALKTLLSPVDAAVLVGELADWLSLSARDGLALSDEGWWEDGVAHLADWGFDLGSIQVPVQVWHGRNDRFVPFQHSEWLAAHVPTCEAHLSDSDGHLTLIAKRIPTIHRWLLDHF